jgi:hypothetical protein
MLESSWDVLKGFVTLPVPPSGDATARHRLRTTELIACEPVDADCQ